MQGYTPIAPPAPTGPNNWAPVAPMDADQYPNAAPRMIDTTSVSINAAEYVNTLWILANDAHHITSQELQLSSANEYAKLLARRIKPCRIKLSGWREVADGTRAAWETMLRRIAKLADMPIVKESKPGRYGGTSFVIGDGGMVVELPILALGDTSLYRRNVSNADSTNVGNNVSALIYVEPHILDNAKLSTDAASVDTISTARRRTTIDTTPARNAAEEYHAAYTGLLVQSIDHTTPPARRAVYARYAAEYYTAWQHATDAADAPRYAGTPTPAQRATRRAQMAQDARRADWQYQRTINARCAAHAADQRRAESEQWIMWRRYLRRIARLGF